MARVFTKGDRRTETDSAERAVFLRWDGWTEIAETDEAASASQQGDVGDEPDHDPEQPKARRKKAE